MKILIFFIFILGITQEISSEIKYPEVYRDPSYSMTFNGFEVIDPYHWMENPKNRTQVVDIYREQINITNVYMSDCNKSNELVESLLKSHSKFYTFGEAKKYSSKYGFESYFDHYIQDDIDSEPRKLKVFPVYEQSISPDGSLVATFLRESQQITVSDTNNGKIISNTTKISSYVFRDSITWKSDNSGFFYIMMAHDSMETMMYYSLSTNENEQNKDILVFSMNNGTFCNTEGYCNKKEISVSEDRKFFYVVQQYRNQTTNKLMQYHNLIKVSANLSVEFIIDLGANAYDLNYNNLDFFDREIEPDYMKFIENVDGKLYFYNSSSISELVLTPKWKINGTLKFDFNWKLLIKLPRKIVSLYPTGRDKVLIIFKKYGESKAPLKDLEVWSLKTGKLFKKTELRINTIRLRKNRDYPVWSSIKSDEVIFCIEFFKRYTEMYRYNTTDPTSKIKIFKKPNESLNITILNVKSGTNNETTEVFIVHDKKIPLIASEVKVAFLRTRNSMDHKTQNIINGVLGISIYIKLNLQLKWEMGKNGRATRKKNSLKEDMENVENNFQLIINTAKELIKRGIVNESNLVLLSEGSKFVEEYEHEILAPTIIRQSPSLFNTVVITGNGGQFKVCPDRPGNKSTTKKSEKNNKQFYKLHKKELNCKDMNSDLMSFYDKFHPFPYFNKKSEDDKKSGEHSCVNPSVLLQMDGTNGLQYITELQHFSKLSEKVACKSQKPILKIMDIESQSFTTYYGDDVHEFGNWGSLICILKKTN